MEELLEQLVFKIEVYEGPLDLLLSLIAKHKMDIKDIKISLIFEQYMAYVETLQQMDMEVAGEFITMASELMLIKSKMLLPKQEKAQKTRRNGSLSKKKIMRADLKRIRMRSSRIRQFWIRWIFIFFPRRSNVCFCVWANVRRRRRMIQ